MALKTPAPSINQESKYENVTISDTNQTTDLISSTIPDRRRLIVIEDSILKKNSLDSLDMTTGLKEQKFEHGDIENWIGFYSRGIANARLTGGDKTWIDHESDSLFPLDLSSDEDLEVSLEDAFAQLVESMEIPWQRGSLTPDRIADAIKVHRTRHPYRND